MPYRIEHRGSEWVVIKKDTGKVKSHHTSKAKAEASIRASYAGEHKKTILGR